MEQTSSHSQFAFFVVVKTEDNQVLQYNDILPTITIGHLKRLVAKHHAIDDFHLIHNITRLDDLAGGAYTTLKDFPEIHSGHVLRLERFKDYQKPSTSAFRPLPHLPYASYECVQDTPRWASTGRSEDKQEASHEGSVEEKDDAARQET